MKDPVDQLMETFERIFPPVEADDAPAEAGNNTVAEGNDDGVPAATQAPCRRTEHASVGYDLELNVEPDQVLDAAKLMDEEGFAIDMVTAIDWPDSNVFEMNYDFMHFEKAVRVLVRTRIDRDEPEIDSLSAIFPGANWHERETSEFFGIQFRGHPNLIHLLLPDDFSGYPLRKDFKPQPDAS